MHSVVVLPVVLSQGLPVCAVLDDVVAGKRDAHVGCRVGLFGSVVGEPSGAVSRVCARLCRRPLQCQGVPRECGAESVDDFADVIGGIGTRCVVEDVPGQVRLAGALMCGMVVPCEHMLHDCNSAGECNDSAVLAAQRRDLGLQRVWVSVVWGGDVCEGAVKEHDARGLGCIGGVDACHGHGQLGGVWREVRL